MLASELVVKRRQRVTIVALAQRPRVSHWRKAFGFRHWTFCLRSATVCYSMRILMISPEGPPLARATALVDVLEALPRELRARHHEVAIAMPFYREIKENGDVEARDTGITVDVLVGEKNYVAEFLEGRTAGGVQTFFVRCDEFFDRTGIYGEHGVALRR